MDAVTSAGDLIKRAAKWGHKAIAITDHGVAQAFPDAHKAAGKAGEDFKVIYGVEGYLIDDVPSSAHKKSAVDLAESYVVFDIETTGLKPQECKDTEIGAIKIENGQYNRKIFTAYQPGLSYSAEHNRVNRNFRRYGC